MNGDTEYCHIISLTNDISNCCPHFYRGAGSNINKHEIKTLSTTQLFFLYSFSDVMTSPLFYTSKYQNCFSVITTSILPKYSVAIPVIFRPASVELAAKYLKLSAETFKMIFK